MWTNLTAYTRGVVFVATVDAVLIGAVLLASASRWRCR